MGLDLTLTALPATAHFALDKARARPEYATYLDTLVAANGAHDLQETRRSYPRELSEALLLELLADIGRIRPFEMPEPTEYYSYSRSYSTIDYLLDEWLKAHGQPRPAGYYYFYNGTELQNEGGRGFTYMLPEQVAAIHEILSQIKFADLLVHYDYERMDEEGVYKLTSPDRLIYMKKEYKMLRAFFWAAHAAGSFVLIDVS